MKRLVPVAAAAAIALSAATSALAQEHTFRFASLTPETGYVHDQHLRAFKEAVEEQSGGRIAIDLQPVGVYGKPNQYHDLVKNGVIDMAWTVQGYTSGTFPQSSVVELPFLYETGEEGSNILWTMFEEGHFDGDYGDVKVLALYTHRPYALFTTGEEVRTVEDLEGLKIRTPSAVVGQSLEAIGAVPVGLPVTEIAENLRRGVIDGSVYPYEAIELFGLGEQVESLTDLKVAAPRFMVIMNRAKYDALPDDLKQVIDENSQGAMSVAIGAGLDEEERKLIEEYEAAGKPVIELDAQTRAKLEERAAPVYEDWLASMEGRGGREILDRARSLAAGS